MIVCVPNVLSPEQLAAVRAGLEKAAFVDGRTTASEHVHNIKNNLQLDERDGRHAKLARAVNEAVLANPLFQAAVWPKALLPFRFSRYEPGMGYGAHVDDPLSQGVRSDVSMTLFLCDPSTYDGGELVIQLAGVERAFKLAAGDMVTYPATTLHHVEPITRGVRLAAVSWAQSYIRDAARRELTFELDMARRSLYQQHGKTPEFDAVSNALANLLRMWADA